MCGGRGSEGEICENGLLKKKKTKDVQFRFSDTDPPERDENGKKGCVWGAKNGRVTRRDRCADERSFNIHRCMYTDRGTCIYIFVCVCVCV